MPPAKRVRYNTQTPTTALTPPPPPPIPTGHHRVSTNTSAFSPTATSKASVPQRAAAKQLQALHRLHKQANHIQSQLPSGPPTSHSTSQPQHQTHLTPPPTHPLPEALKLDILPLKPTMLCSASTTSFSHFNPRWSAYCPCYIHRTIFPLFHLGASCDYRTIPFQQHRCLHHTHQSPPRRPKYSTKSMLIRVALLRFKILSPWMPWKLLSNEEPIHLPKHLKPPQR
ncbi:expressed unknown protein [Seminavis robusta]|uniref:Uncharacterized protein n=1 Tax=Seminavis robusta TaxID=568900 RepID=A0A9N8DF56_9STRA|nr:expressed unknown protein [Seminavis robusta]|eukprot:Sro65_g036700.1 n/a (226) ;mRNA; r:55202-55962